MEPAMAGITLHVLTIFVFLYCFSADPTINILDRSAIYFQYWASTLGIRRTAILWRCGGSSFSLTASLIFDMTEFHV